MKKSIRRLLIIFLDKIRDYERESLTMIAFDERDSEEFVDIFYKEFENENNRNINSKRV